MRIAGFIFVVLILLSSVSFFFSARALWFAHQKVTVDEELSALAKAKSDWYTGTVALSLERSVTQVALAREEPISQDFRTLINQQRAESDRLLRLALSALNTITTFENYEPFVAHEDKVRARIAELREEADALLAVPRDVRNASRAKGMPYELKAEIEALFSSADLLVLPGTQTSVSATTLSRIQAKALEIREYGGRARTFYAIASLLREPIPEENLGEAHVDTRRAVAGWDQLRTMAAATPLPTAFLEEIDAVEGPFVETYLPALDAIDAAMSRMRDGDTDATLPYTFDSFFALSNEGLHSVADLAGIAGVFIQDHWAQQLQTSRNIRLINGVVMVFILAIMIASIIGLQRKLIRPLSAATSVLQRMAEGDLDRDFRKKKRGLDEIWVIWQAMDKLSQTLRDARQRAEQEKESERRAKEGIVGELMTGLKKLSDGDFTHDVPNAYGPAYEQLVLNYNGTSKKLRQLVADVKTNAADIESQSRDLRSAIEDLSSRTEEQSVSVAQTVTRLGDFSGQIRDMAELAQGSGTLVSDASHRATESAEVVESAIDAMDRIKESSKEISSFIDVINEIAFQTNLLALNASVEASRAGDAGKGFAVVANEIRGLAQRAEESASDITKLIEQSAAQVDAGVRRVTKTGESLREISQMVMQIRSGFSEIDTASQSQLQGVTEIGTTMNQLDQMTKQNALMAEQTTDTSAHLQEQSKALRAAVDLFVVDTGRTHQPRAA